MPQLCAGERVTTPGRTIGEGDVNLFAGLVGDFTPIHVDADSRSDARTAGASHMARSRWRPRSAC